ncbi:MAG: aa3-type cytochrome c oxidase subunit IV [Pseudomonadota bacterium]
MMMENMKEPEFHEHVRTYRGFLRACVWAIASVVVVLAFLGLFFT